MGRPQALQTPTRRIAVEPFSLLILVVAGFVASFIDAQVGGGGIITLPAYLLVGLPPHQALGTNKVGGTASALVASINYVRSGLVGLEEVLRYVGFSLVGGAVGVYLALGTDGRYLIPAVLVVMVAMTLWILLRPAFGKTESSRPLWMAWAMAGAALLIGLYDGILGPGTGSMLLVAIVALLGFTYRQASGLGRVLNLGSNVSALTYFVISNQVDWSLGIPMAVSMGIGGYVGSHVNLRHGDKTLKPLLVVVSLLLMGLLVYRYYSP